MIRRSAYLRDVRSSESEFVAHQAPFSKGEVEHDGEEGVDG